MNKKVISMLVLCIGIVLSVVGGYGAFSGKVDYEKITRINESTDLAAMEGKCVIVSGQIDWNDNAKDELFSVVSENSILLRRREIVQTMVRNDGTKTLVFSEDILTIPEGNMPETDIPAITSDVITEMTTIGGIPVGKTVLKAFTYSAYPGFTDAVILCQITDLGESLHPDFVANGGYYVSASDEWNVGEERISYYYPDIDKRKTYTVIGRVTDGVVEIDTSMLNHGVFDRELQQSEYSSATGIPKIAFIVSLAVGVILIVYGVYICIKNKKAVNL